MSSVMIQTRPKQKGFDLEQYRINTLRAPDFHPRSNIRGRCADARRTRRDGVTWHAHPVWFLDGNPTVGYSKQKPGIRLMFWSGADFEETGLNVVGKKFKDASVFFNDVAEIKKTDVRRWLKKAQEIQWDYRNLVKRKGRLEKLT